MTKDLRMLNLKTISNPTALILGIGLRWLDSALRDSKTGCLPKPKEVRINSMQRFCLREGFQRVLSFKDLQSNRLLLAKLRMFIKLLDPNTDERDSDLQRFRYDRSVRKRAFMRDLQRVWESASRN